MGIGGFQRHTLTDYPGKVACIVFFSGCNFRCPWCHNGDLVNSVGDSYEVNDIILEIMKIRKWIDGVVISGGEPTLSPELIKFCAKIKDKGLLVKLDTNGSKPVVIQELIDKKLVDYIAMDVKTALNEYEKAIGVKFDSAKIQESLQLIMEGNIDYEFRSTIVPDFFQEMQFREVLRTIQGAKRFILQQYDPQHRMDSTQCKKSYSKSLLQEWEKKGAAFVEECLVRSTS